jgi:SPP1 gp7 family putative phage head morphogenesis protein
MSDTMRSRLEESDYIFSGLKTFHELNEAFPSLLDEDGSKKPFERFLNDVQKVDETYNRNYLRAEYNFAGASAEMAARWENYEKDGDEYYLQYRTAGDDKVRPEHAALNGVTLPMSDPFWDEYYPPNGWNCRCNVVQGLKGTNTPTDRDEAYRRAQNALGKDTRGMFRFNSGKQEKTFPDYNPYTISKCATCDIAKGKLKLSFIPESELCAACKLVRQINKGNNDWEVHRSIIASSRKSLEDWYKTNLPTQSIGNIKAKRFEVTASDGTDVIINRSFYNESISKYKTDPIYPIKLEYAKRVHELIKTATLIDPNEKSIDYPDAYFKVYETIDDCYRVEMKIRCNNDGNYMHILRVYKK